MFLLQALNWCCYGTSGYQKLCFLRVPVLQWNKHPTQFNLKKVKRRKLKSLIVHCEKLSNSQIGFYTIRIWTLSTQCSHGEIGEIAIPKDFLLKLFHKKAFPWQFDKIKGKFLFAHRLFFYEYKMILALAHWIFFYVMLNRKSIWHCLT